MAEENELMRETICKGCTTLATIERMQRGIAQCAVKPSMGHQVCPCSTCLIKMICEETCYPFQMYLSNDRERIKEN